MLKFLDRRVAAPGEIIFKEGETGDKAFIVQSGIVELCKSSQAFAEVGTNAIFGEMALIDGAPRMATARAKTEVTLIVVPRALLDNKLKGVDPFVTRLLAILVQNVRSMADKL
ncbi:cAMP-binding protein [Paramagnetospirillum kuznetsovii]|uniref:cAMP-binding protein n=1 Tax=Paramagnetospirillum kuznetsovii TaxID=2053833 RepID=A0A364NWG4_9PROT|nr:cyclic nucleotide-binding domain-containing protein [Paramagnetospirillum kuznetsovii]RAU21396.1 cAMP-binding protein [Paramagnetospirillum kuznetsovii]